MLACPASTSDLSSVSTIGLPGAMFDVEPVSMHWALCIVSGFRRRREEGNNRSAAAAVDSPRRAALPGKN